MAIEHVIYLSRAVLEVGLVQLVRRQLPSYALFPPTEPRRATEINGPLFTVYINDGDSEWEPGGYRVAFRSHVTFRLHRTDDDREQNRAMVRIFLAILAATDADVGLFFNWDRCDALRVGGRLLLNDNPEQFWRWYDLAQYVERPFEWAKLAPEPPPPGTILPLDDDDFDLLEARRKDRKPG